MNQSMRCLNILVIDESLILDLLNKSLTYFGHSVFAFNEVVNALNVFEVNPLNFDVIIIDQKYVEILKSLPPFNNDADATTLITNHFNRIHRTPFLIWGENIQSTELKFSNETSIYLLNKNYNALKTIGNWLSDVAKEYPVMSDVNKADESAVYQLIYASKAVDNLCENDLIAILTTARKFNQLSYITGMLIYHHGFFLQIIEGEKADIINLFYSQITNDKRHHNISVFHEGYALKREFPNWQMGFYGTTGHENYSLLAITDFKNHPAGQFFRRHLTQIQKHFLHFELDDFDYLPCLILITDNNGIIVKANTELLLLIGKERDDVEGKSINELLPPASRIFLQTHVWTMLCHQGSVNEIHLKLCGQDHARIPVILNCKKGLFEGVESYFWTFFVSIERDKFEVEILESQRRTESILKTIFHISPNGYLLVDDSHRILFANDMIARLIEHSVQDLYALSSHQFWSYLVSHSQKNFSIPQEIGETHYIDLIKPRLIKLVCSMQPIVLSNGNALGSLFYFNDITKEEESNRIKSEFLTHASHELRTPLALIHGYSELLDNEIVSVESQSSITHMIYEQSTWLIAMVDELLDLHRIETRAGIGFEKYKYLFNDLIHEALAEFAIPKGRQAISLSLPPELKNIDLYVDKVKFKQVISYIIDNAYKYSSNEDRASLYTSFNTANNALDIEISDEGIGVAETDIPLIFERFYRVDKSGNIPGMGLGLTIAKEIMMFLNGEIHFNSVPNQGSQVVVRFYL
ncbi:MAG: BLUF domain-containing protein [Methylococcales bacterium]|nr:BLUF domain-containing protein [Methylococcales bacterium]